MLLRISLRGRVRPSVRLSIRPSVRPYVHMSRVISCFLMTKEFGADDRILKAELYHSLAHRERKKDYISFSFFCYAVHEITIVI